MTDIIPEYLINLIDSHVSPKVYWSIFKMFLNDKKTNDKIKIKIIPPYFYEKRPIGDFTKKTELFNLSFLVHCN